MALRLVLGSTSLESQTSPLIRLLHANLWRSLATLHANLWRPLATLQYVLQGAVTCGERRSKIGHLTSNNNRVSASSQLRSNSALLFDLAVEDSQRALGRRGTT